MTYGTLEYWRNQADQVGRQAAGLRKENEELWRRLVNAERMAARAGVDVQDPKLIAHSIELEVMEVAAGINGEALDAMRRGILADLFEVQDRITEHGLDKAAAFDWLAKRIPIRNSKAFPDNAAAKAREIVTTGRADAVLAEGVLF